MKNRIILLIILILVLIMLIIKNINNSNTEEVLSKSTENIVLENYIEILGESTLKNNSEELKKNKEIDELVISNLRITAKNKETIIMMDIQNNSKQIKGNKEVTLIMNDKNTYEIGKIGVNISELRPNESVTLEIETEIDFINTYDFTIIDKPIIDIIED